MKKRVLILIGLSLFVAKGYAAEEVMMSHLELTHDAIRQRVGALRQERYDQMPYMERELINNMISAEGVRRKELFLVEGARSLQGLIERALQVHTPTRAATERISLAYRRVVVSVRDFFPEASFDFQERDGKLSGTKFNSFSYRVNMRQPIYRGGVIWNTLLQEQAGLEAARKEYDAIIGTLARDLSTAYFEYNRAIEVVLGQQAAIEAMNAFVDISEQKYGEEFISEIEHLNVQSLFSQFKFDHETSKQELELAKLDLQKFLGLELADELLIEPLYDMNQLLKDYKQYDDEGIVPEYTPALFETALGIPDLISLVDMAYENRAELKVEVARLESARLEERIRAGSFMPEVDAVLEFGKLGEAFDILSTDPGLTSEFRFSVEINWNAMGNNFNYTFENNESAPSVTQFQGNGSSGTQTTRNTISVGILDGLGDYVDLKEAQVARLEQVIELENTEKEVIQEVKRAYYDYQKARIQVKSTLQRVDYRKRLAQLAKHRLDKNEVQISEYLQAEIDFVKEVGTLHRALTDYFTAKSSLNHAVGVRDFVKIEEWT